MHVAQLWVYPVKSLAGQRLERTRIGRDGIPGDRRVQVRDAREQLVTARTRHALLGLRGPSATGHHVAQEGAVAVGDPVELLV